MYNKEIIVTDFAKTGGNLGGILHQSKRGDSPPIKTQDSPPIKTQGFYNTFD